MKRALLVIDVQNEYFTGKIPVTYPAGSLANIVKAMDVALRNNFPTIIIQHTNSNPEAVTFAKGSPTWQLHPAISQKSYTYLVEKQLPGSFTGTNLETLLKQEGIDTVVVCGYMTQMCCDTTARQANHLGYQVEFLADATGTPAITNYAGSVTAEELHRAILVTQAMRFSQVLSTEEWIKKFTVPNA